MENLLIKGDNLCALEYLLQERQLGGMVDLVYIDPPFATNCTFTVGDGRASTVSQSKGGKVAYSDRLLGGEFLEYLRPRLLLLRELLSEQGSIYLHIDYKIGHYVKVLMDEVFGVENFRNDITRIKCNPKNFKRIGYGNIKDLILFYTKGSAPIWHEPKEAYSEHDMQRLYTKQEADDKKYTTVPIHAPGETKSGESAKPFKGLLPPRGRHWRVDVETLERWDAEGLIEWSSTGNPRKKIYADEQSGKRIQDIWEFKDPQYPVYPTEKNRDLLDLIVKTSSDTTSIVLDCFCGSGTTLSAACSANRTWIGVDQSDLAIEATKKKIAEMPEGLFGSASYEYIEL